MGEAMVESNFLYKWSCVFRCWISKLHYWLLPGADPTTIAEEIGIEPFDIQPVEQCGGGE
jgi:hypothetical protein